MNIHGFDKDAAVFSNLYYMSKANDCPYTKRWPIDIEAAVGRDGRYTSETHDRIVKNKVRPCEAFLKFDNGGLDVILVEDQ